MSYDCDNFDDFEMMFKKAGFSNSEIQKSMDILSNFCGLEYKDLLQITKNIIKKGVKS